jgi:hypothetical protein
MARGQRKRREEEWEIRGVVISETTSFNFGKRRDNGKSATNVIENVCLLVTVIHTTVKQNI